RPAVMMAGASMRGRGWGRGSAPPEARKRRDGPGLGSLDRERERASLDALQGADVHHPPSHFLVAFVAHGDQDGELGGRVHALRIEGALDLPRGPGGGDATGTRVLVEAQVVLAARADDRTLEDR